MGAIMRFLWRRPKLLLAAGLLLFCYTGWKLHRMARIRGWIAGAPDVEKRVTDRLSKTVPTRTGMREVYWLAWDGGDADVPGRHRINVERHVFEATQIGDTIRLVFEDGDPYLRDGIYVSRGNFIFDVCLLAFELALCVVATVRLLRRRRET